MCSGISIYHTDIHYVKAVYILEIIKFVNSCISVQSEALEFLYVFTVSCLKCITIVISSLIAYIRLRILQK